MFFRKSLILIMLLTWALMLSPVRAQDNDKFNLVILENGDSLTRTFENNITAHLFAFNATAGDIVTLEMCATAKPETAEEIPDFLDPYLVLLGAWGEYLIGDDDSGEALDALIQNYTIPTDGSYFVLATSFVYLNNVLVESESAAEDAEESPPFKYNLTINGITPPEHLENFDISHVQIFRGDLNIDAGGATGMVTEQEPIFYLGMPGKAGQTVDITLSSDEFDTMLYLFSPGGFRVAINDDDTENEGTNSAIRNYTLEEDGLYIIFATDVFFYRAGQELEEGRLPFEGGIFTLEARSH